MHDFFIIPAVVVADMDAEQLHTELAALAIPNLVSTVITQRQITPDDKTVLDGQGKPVLGLLEGDHHGGRSADCGPVWMLYDQRVRGH